MSRSRLLSCSFHGTISAETSYIGSTYQKQQLANDMKCYLILCNDAASSVQVSERSSILRVSIDVASIMKSP
jgi:hypothetical protein